MIHVLHRGFAFAAVAVMIAACACMPPPGTRGETTAPVSVKITSDGAGGYSFRYSSSFADPDGNIDLRTEADAVTLRFTIEPDSVDGLRFKASGREAMWIVATKGDGSPQGAYRGEQFNRFEVSADGRTLSVFDLNNDSTRYRYALRFDLNGATVQHDPDLNNGNGGGT